MRISEAEVQEAVAHFQAEGGLIEKLPPVKTIQRSGYARPASLGNNGVHGGGMVIDQTATRDPVEKAKQVKPAPVKAGDRFGHLKVLEVLRMGRIWNAWVRCDCGNERFFRAVSLTHLESGWCSFNCKARERG